jgi:hypothetical protein
VTSSQVFSSQVASKPEVSSFLNVLGEPSCLEARSLEFSQCSGRAKCRSLEFSLVFEPRKSRHLRSPLGNFKLYIYIYVYNIVYKHRMAIPHKLWEQVCACRAESQGHSVIMNMNACVVAFMDSPAASDNAVLTQSERITNAKAVA